MSKSQQDQFIDDDEEETCPLCVEEFDLTDKGFRPCPCGYQICQFCYNNVKNNMNGLCPACRRQYDDKDIEYKVITPEESAAHKARQAQKQKKTAAALQKEKQKAEADNLSRKHLAGLRVVQKNLVYVTGLAPTSQEDQLLATLRTDQYFGQYGKIIKIVVSKARDPVHEHSVGVYVTYERKDDAELCIKMVNGSNNGDRTLRAQFGTTKYCSAYLRGETCMNRSCMFLHEPGEANDSYSRADLSALNAGGSQQTQSRAPPQSQQPVAASSQSQPMARQGSDQSHSPGASRPALASTSSWAAPKPVRTESRVVSNTSESPAPAPAPSLPEEPTPAPEPTPQDATPEPQQAPLPPPTRRARSPDPLLSLLKNFDVNGFKFVYSDAALSEEERKIVNSYPPLFDLSIGVKRRQRMKEDEARRLQLEVQTFNPPPGLGGDAISAVSGSLQLGGEPEERQDQSQPQSAIQPPSADGMLDQRFQFGGIASPAGLSDRGLTPQQHQQLLLQTMKSPNAQGSYLNSMGSPASFQQPQSNPPGHQRNTSRYSFANESSASTSVKPVANAKLLNQQSAMMPQQSSGNNHFSANQQQQQQPGHFFTSNVQGPPPGLKTTGTPPVSGGMTFGQGHGFATGGLQYGGLGSAGANRNNQNEELMRSLMRTQREGGAEKREYSPFPNMQQHGSVSGGHGFPTGAQGPPSYASLSSYSGEEKQRKKKGKKHRHGNASSSSTGLGGDMDSSAPPQILQARFQPGFATSDADFPPLGPSRQAPSRQQSISLTTGTRKSTPDVPPGFEHHAASLSQSGRATPTIPPGLEGLGLSSGRATPTLPPGLPAIPSGLTKPLTAVPADVAEDVAAGAGTISRPGSRAALKRQITPVLPLRPATPKREVSMAGKGKEKVVEKEAEVETPTKKPVEAKKPTVIAEESNGKGKGKEVVKEVRAEIDAVKAEPATAPMPALAKVKEEEAAKPPTSPKAERKSTQPATKSTATTQTSETKAVPVTPSKQPEAPRGRKHPGKLDITAAVDKTPERAVAQAKAGAVDVSAPTTASNTPSKVESPIVASPVVKVGGAPRTLRVVQTPTPKAETPPVTSVPASAAPTPVPAAPAEKPKDAVPAAVRAPSRQPSVASIQNLPGTPSSEQVSISDNISMTSTSQSRANSPPPSAGVGSKIVGSAPVRQRTKAQAKKGRQERAKQLEEERVKNEAEASAVAKIEEEAAQQEAIVSRKKKARKEKPAPAPKPPAKGKEKEEVKAAAAVDKTPNVSRAPSPSPSSAKAEKTTPSAAKASKPSTPTRTPTLPSQQSEPSPPPTPTLTAAQIIAELKATAPEIQKSIDSLLRASPTSGTSGTFKPSQPITAKDLANPSGAGGWRSDVRFQLSKEDVDALLTGSMPGGKRFGGKEGRQWDRGMVSPGGATLRALTQELESRFLELERAIRELPEELRFRATKPQNETRFPGIDLESLKRELETSMTAGFNAASGGTSGGMGGSGVNGGAGAGVSGRGGSAMEQMVHDGSGTKRGAFLLDEVGKYINEFVMPPATPPPQHAQMVQPQPQPHIPVAGGHAQPLTVRQEVGMEPIYGAQAVVGGGVGGGGGGGVSVEIAERQLAEARRVSEEREGALRKVARKNRRVLGLG